jgi:hypothetical protein
MPRGVMTTARKLRAQAQTVAAQERDVKGQVAGVDTFANAINNAIAGTIIATLQDELDSRPTFP